MFNLGFPCLFEKSIELVLDRLIANLFDANHMSTLLISFESVLFNWLIFRLLNKTVVSSAKSMNFSNLEQFTMSLMNNKNKRGPSVDP